MEKNKQYLLYISIMLSSLIRLFISLSIFLYLYYKFEDSCVKKKKPHPVLVQIFQNSPHLSVFALSVLNMLFTCICKFIFIFSLCWNYPAIKKYLSLKYFFYTLSILSDISDKIEYVFPVFFFWLFCVFILKVYLL